MARSSHLSLLLTGTPLQNNMTELWSLLVSATKALRDDPDGSSRSTRAFPASAFDVILPDAMASCGASRGRDIASVGGARGRTHRPQIAASHDTQVLRPRGPGRGLAVQEKDEDAEDDGSSFLLY